MKSFALTEPQKKILIDSDAAIVANHALIWALTGLIDSLNAAAPVDNLLWERPVTGESPVYTYRIVLKDGRKWNQIVTFIAGAPEPTMSFTVGDQWKASEFTLQRPIREQLTLYALSLGLSKLRVIYL